MNKSLGIICGVIVLVIALAIGIGVGYNLKDNNKVKEKEVRNKNLSNKESKVKSQYIDLTDIPISNVNVTKNEEMMKQIKNTLDDNLKVMFNFSYENFLSKESESESKKSSQQDIVLSDQNE